MDSKFYIKNREKIFAKLKDNSAAFIFSNKAPLRSEDENYNYVVNRNFFYLTGVIEQDDVLVLLKKNNINKSIIIGHKEDPKLTKWIGSPVTNKELIKTSGVDEVYYDCDIKELLKIVKQYKNIYFDFSGMNKSYPTNPATLFKNKYFKFKKVNDCYELIATCRLVKEKEEVEAIKKAIHITNVSLEETKKVLKDGNNENDLDATFAYNIFKNGASDFAFKTIVASGVHSCTLHYSVNKDTLHDGDVCLFDLGAAYNQYSSDISRTFPVNGKFNDRQQLFYNMVLKAQELVFKAAKPGVTIKELNDIVIKFYIDELKKINLIKEDKEVEKYYYHNVSHHLGLDTHDVASLRKDGYTTPLVEGNIITVEPGIYIEEEKIGIRIEDDILITKNGCEVLSKEIAK